MILLLEELFYQPVENDQITYDKMFKITTGQGDDYATVCLLDYSYSNNYYKMIPIDLIKQQVLEAYPKTLKQINFTGNLDPAGNTTMLYIIEKAEETILNFSEGTMKVLEICFALR